MQLHDLYNLGIILFGCLFFMYIAFKTKYFDYFILNPSSKFYKQNVKTYINNHHIKHKSNQFMQNNINQIRQKEKSLVNQTTLLTSYRSVFQKFYCLFFLVILSGIIMYLFLYKNFSNQKSSDVGIFFEIFVVICICCALLRFGCYFFCDVYVFASYISMFFAILFAFLYGIMFAFLYFLEYLFLKEAQAHVFLQYFLQLFVLLPLSLFFLIVFYISFLYQTKKVQVNSKFHSFLKICFIISFFVNHLFYFIYFHIELYGS